MNVRKSAIPLLAMFCIASARAESGATLDQLLSLSMANLMALKVRISTNTEQSLSKAPSAVSVITEDDIRATGATNLADILQSVPGLYVKENLFGFRPIITFRGASGNQTLLMLNGEPMNDLVWFFGIYWKGLPTSMISRVEIIRGPGSALYGAGASAGVINVITKSAGRVDQDVAGLRAGSFDSQEGWFQKGGKWFGFDIGLTADLSHTNGHDPLIKSDAQTAADLTNHTHVSYAPGIANYGWNGQTLDFSARRDHWRLLVDYIGHDDLATGLTGAGVLDPVTRGNDHRYNVGLHYDNERFTPDWGLNAEVRYHKLDYSSGNGFQERPPGYTDASGLYPDGEINLQRAAEDGYTVEASGQYNGLKGHALRLGAGFSREDLYRVEQWVNSGTGPDGNPLPAGGPLVDLSGSPYAFAPTMDRRIGYLYAQDVWNLSDDWELTGGARYDHYSDFGGTLNPRLALVWQATPRLTTKLMYGRAFRAPSYQELYSLTSAARPNPNLTPERSQTIDLLFAYEALHNLNLSLDLYQFAQTNLIAADASNQYQNLGNSKSRGVELEARWAPTDTVGMIGNVSHRLSGHATILDHSVPNDKAYLRLDWAFARHWNWDLQVNWIGRRDLPPGDPRQPLDAYTLLDTTLRYSPGGSAWEFAGSIRNLANAEAADYSSKALPYNLPLPGRSMYLEIRYKF